MIKISDPLIGEEEVAAAKRALLSGVLARGSETKKFEEDFARYIGTEHAIATSNGTTALHAALAANGIDFGEVITPSFSFVASANCIIYSGARPVFADVDPVTFNITAESIEEKITKNTRAVIAVHLYGQPCDIKKIKRLCDSYGLVLIEDACQSHGAEHHGKKVGSFDTGCFSFYATKNITTGEGGIITTNDEKVAQKARMIISHGSTKNYDNKTLGYNFRMTEMQAAIGNVQLEKLDMINKKRAENAAYFTELFRNTEGVETPVISGGNKHVFHQYTIKSENRDAIARALEADGVGYGIYYPKPIHKQDFYINLGYTDKIPVCENLASRVISLPVHPKVSQQDIEKIVSCVRDAL